MTKRLPLRVRAALAWHMLRTGHTGYRVNTAISVPSFDPSALGVLAVCGCERVWAW